MVQVRDTLFLGTRCTYPRSRVCICLRASVLVQIMADAHNVGKTTFVNTLCEQNVIEHKDSDNAQTAHVELGLQIQPVNLGMCVCVRAKAKTTRIETYMVTQRWNRRGCALA